MSLLKSYIFPSPPSFIETLTCIGKTMGVSGNTNVFSGVNLISTSLPLSVIAILPIGVDVLSFITLSPSNSYPCGASIETLFKANFELF